MAVKFNPFSGQLQINEKGASASYIDGEVATYNDLPLSSTTAPLDSAWLVRGSSGVWPFTKPGGVYVRTATGGSSRDADYTYAGVFPDVFSDAVLTIYDEASTTRTGQFNLGSITAGQNRVLTWPDGNGTIALLTDFLAAIKDMKVAAPSGDFTATSTTTLANVTGMSFSVAANTTYLVATNLQMNCGAGGYMLELSFPSILNNGTTASGFGVQLNGSNAVSGLSTTSATTVRVSNRGAAQTTPSFSILLVRTDSTGGTANFQWAQNGSNAAASTLSASSRAIIIPLTA